MGRISVQPVLIVAALAGTLAAPVFLSAGDWPQFRGLNGDGIAVEEKPLTEWSGEKNVVWKAPLPSPGNGSPIVSNGCVFVACAEDKEGRGRSLYCFDRKTGKQRWVRTVQFDKVLPTHETNLYCGSTPASDGKRVVVWHASAGLHCYDFEGKELWKQDLGEYIHMWGYGTSPVLVNDQVVMHCGPGKSIRLVALDLATGKIKWDVQEPVEGDGDHNLEEKYMGSWSTPIIATADGKQPKKQVICVMPTRVVAYDADNGHLDWYCEGVRGPRGDLAYSSPVIVDDICVVTGGFQGPGLGIRLGGSGNVTETHRLWHEEKNPQSIGSAVAIDGYVYRPNAGPGTIDCQDPKTGKLQWTTREGGTHWASIVSANGLLYATNQDGATIVFRPNPKKFEEIATNKLGEATNATPAISDGQIFMRTFENVYCLGEE